jgi:C-terminal processing protease CtpA/Prc
MWVWQWLQAGILGGEQLWAVDGIAVDSLTRDEAGALLRGPIGSMVSHFFLAKQAFASHVLGSW